MTTPQSGPNGEALLSSLVFASLLRRAPSAAKVAPLVQFTKSFGGHQTRVTRDGAVHILASLCDPRSLSEIAEDLALRVERDLLLLEERRIPRSEKAPFQRRDKVRRVSFLEKEESSPTQARAEERKRIRLIERLTAEARALSREPS